MKFGNAGRIRPALIVCQQAGETPTEPSSCIPHVPGGNSFPIKPIGSARATEWEGGGSLLPI